MAHKPTKERYLKVTLYECDPATDETNVLSDEHNHKILFEDEAIAHDPSYIQDRARNLGWMASEKLREIQTAESPEEDLPMTDEEYRESLS